MNMWCHLPTSLKRRLVLLSVVLAVMVVAITTTLIFARAAHAAPSVNKTISFNGRLLTASGAVVPDGHYNIQFKIYQDGTGTAAGNPGGTLKWTETYINNGGENGVEVRNGFFSVALGSSNPFGTSIDWNQDTLFLSMNVAGSDAGCLAFGTAPCAADGEMLPMKRMTATPYAINSGQLGGKTADQFVQLGQGAQTDASNDSSVYINKTGNGNLMQLQNNGEDAFTVANNGDLILGGNDDRSISLSQSAADTAGNQLTVKAGAGGSGSGSAGGDLVLEGGDAGGTDGNGGNLVLSGGAGTGTGAPGLVILDTPTFSTTTNDPNCYTNGTVVASSCTVATSTVNTSAAALVGFSADGQTATLPDPTITTPGRIIYIMAASGSKDFTLRANAGGGAGIEQKVTMRQNTAATMIWNGTDWTVVGASNATTLQDAYDNTPSSANGDELVLNNTTGGLTLRDSGTDPVDDTLLEVKNTSGDMIFSVNKQVSDSSEIATDGNVNDGTNFATNWPAVGGSATRNTTDGQEGSDSAQADAGTAAGNGIRNKLAANLATNADYRVSVYAKLVSGDAFTDFKVRYSPDGGSTFADCTSYNARTVTTSGWTQITCSLNAGATAATDPYVYFVQPTASSTARTFLVDAFSLTRAPSTTQNVKVGSKTSGSSSPTLFTLDKAASAPSGSGDALLGSMYYDTTLDKVQCYEAEGWGACGAAPDTFVTISPEYTNAVMNGNDIGTITSDLCSDTLNINDGSSSQPTVCGTDETYNFYKWTSGETTDQTRSIFVTYQLPANFKEFVSGSTSLMGRTDSNDSNVEYQIYRDDGNGLTSCGSAVSVSTGTQTSWQKATATGSADPSDCNFEAGDSIFIRINLTAKNDADAYVSNLGFTFSNN